MDVQRDRRIFGWRSSSLVFPTRAGQRSKAAGTTLLELIVACAILVVLATVAVPLARNQIRRTKENQLRWDLREIPMDPMTKNKDWGLRSVQDDVDATGWGGQDVFDVYSKSSGTALDGTKYSDW